jgi:hypothetical protein
VVGIKAVRPGPPRPRDPAATGLETTAGDRWLDAAKDALREGRARPGSVAERNSVGKWRRSALEPVRGGRHVPLFTPRPVIKARRETR